MKSENKTSPREKEYIRKRSKTKDCAKKNDLIKRERRETDNRHKQIKGEKTKEHEYLNCNKVQKGIFFLKYEKKCIKKGENKDHIKTYKDRMCKEQTIQRMRKIERERNRDEQKEHKKSV